MGKDSRAFKLATENAGFIALRICLCKSPVAVSNPNPAVNPTIFRKKSGLRHHSQYAIPSIAQRKEQVTHSRILEAIRYQNLVHGLGV